MPVRTIPGAGLDYYLVCVDGTGAERTDDPDGIDGRLIARVEEALAAQPYTDVFLMSHGWMGDVPAAVRQYDAWIGAMAACEDDLAWARRTRPGFSPLLVGLHWPSLPFGDEELGGGPDVSFATPVVGAVALPDTAALVDAYADRLADTPAARDALQTIFNAATTDTAPLELSDEVVEAYRVLDREAGLGSGGPANAPGSDRESFDPAEAYETAVDEEGDVSFGIGRPLLGPVVGILRHLSFFKMKDRARTIGETSFHTLLGNLQRAAGQSGRDVRFHLMGHSFGCVVVSATLAGPAGAPDLDPVHSAFLAQGAVSFWSYCSQIPYAHGNPGYFRSIIDGRRVLGALVTTQSEHDTAVCKLYPAASFAGRDVVFAPGELPKYGALGAFGAQGEGVDPVALAMLESGQPYEFERGKVYNIDGSRYIAHMQSLGAGAHNDIAHPEVAHAYWSAALLETAG
jgi:hypothetical protein